MAWWRICLLLAALCCAASAQQAFLYITSPQYNQQFRGGEPVTVTWEQGFANEDFSAYIVQTTAQGANIVVSIGNFKKSQGSLTFTMPAYAPSSTALWIAFTPVGQLSVLAYSADFISVKNECSSHDGCTETQYCDLNKLCFPCVECAEAGDGLGGFCPIKCGGTVLGDPLKPGEQIPVGRETTVVGFVSGIVAPTCPQYQFLDNDPIDLATAAANSPGKEPLRLTSRIRSKLTGLAASVAGWDDGQYRLHILNGYESQVVEGESLTPHHEGRAADITVVDGGGKFQEQLLGQLAGQAGLAKFDFVQFPETADMVHVSVIGDSCQQPVDLIFLLDSSGSIENEWSQGSPGAFSDKILASVRDIVSFFEISETQTRVGVASFSEDVTVHFNLNTHFSKANVLNAISNIPFAGGSTATGDGIQKVMDSMFQPAAGMRDVSEGVPRVLVVITDGETTAGVPPGPVAAQLRAQNVNIYAVGIGNFNEQELQLIASDPDEEFIFKLKSLAVVPELVDKMSSVACDAAAVVDPFATTTGQVSECSTRFFRSESDVFDGFSVRLRVLSGKADLHVSRSIPNPVAGNADISDTSDIELKVIRVTNPVDDPRPVFVGVTAESDSAQFELDISGECAQVPTVDNAIELCQSAAVSEACEVLCDEHNGYRLTHNSLECNGDGTFTGHAQCEVGTPTVRSTVTCVGQDSQMQDGARPGETMLCSIHPRDESGNPVTSLMSSFVQPVADSDELQPVVGALTFVPGGERIDFEVTAQLPGQLSLTIGLANEGQLAKTVTIFPFPSAKNSFFSCASKATGEASLVPSETAVCTINPRDDKDNFVLGFPSDFTIDVTGGTLVNQATTRTRRLSLAIAPPLEFEVRAPASDRTLLSIDVKVRPNDIGIKGSPLRPVIVPFPLPKAAVCTSSGDPHYVSFDGRRFDYYGIGEYSLVKSDNLIIQTRHQRWGRASANVAFAMSGAWLNGSRVGVYGADSALVLRVDGAAVVPNDFDLPGVTLTSSGRTMTFTFADGSFISATAWGSGGFMNIQVSLMNAMMGLPTGLCGNFNGLSGDDAFVEQDIIIRLDDSLFEYIGTTREEIFDVPDGFVPGDTCENNPDLETQAAIKCEAAEDMKDECIKDICATGDLDAGDLMIEAAEQDRLARERLRQEEARRLAHRPGVCSSAGDPHYTSFDGARFDYYGIGEFYLVKSDALVIQTRLAPRGRASVNEAFAVSGELLDGHVLAFYRNGNNFVTQFNGATVNELPVDLEYDVAVASNRIKLNAGNASVTAGYYTSGVFNIYVSLGGEFRLTVTGLCGDFGNDPGNDGPAGDGDTNVERVTPETSLFSYTGTSFEEVNTPPDGFEPGDTCNDDVFLKQAQEACAPAEGFFHECVKDACALGSLNGIDWTIDAFKELESLLEDAKLVEQNFNDPEFDRPEYSFEVARDATLGTVVGTVSASDADAGVNGQVAFLLGAGATGRLAVDINTGVITVGPLGVQCDLGGDCAPLTVTIIAVDNGDRASPPRWWSRRTTTTVTITLRNTPKTSCLAPECLPSVFVRRATLTANFATPVTRSQLRDLQRAVFRALQAQLSAIASGITLIDRGAVLVSATTVRFRLTVSLSGTQSTLNAVTQITATTALNAISAISGTITFATPDGTDATVQLSLDAWCRTNTPYPFARLGFGLNDRNRRWRCYSGQALDFGADTSCLVNSLDGTEALCSRCAGLYAGTSPLYWTMHSQLTSLASDLLGGRSSLLMCLARSTTLALTPVAAGTGVILTQETSLTFQGLAGVSVSVTATAIPGTLLRGLFDGVLALGCPVPGCAWTPSSAAVLTLTLGSTPFTGTAIAFVRVFTQAAPLRNRVLRLLARSGAGPELDVIATIDSTLAFNVDPASGLFFIDIAVARVVLSLQLDVPANFELRELQFHLPTGGLASVSSTEVIVGGTGGTSVLGWPIVSVTQGMTVFTDVANVLLPAFTFGLDVVRGPSSVTGRVDFALDLAAPGFVYFFTTSPTAGLPGWILDQFADVRAVIVNQVTVAWSVFVRNAGRLTLLPSGSGTTLGITVVLRPFFPPVAPEFRLLDGTRFPESVTVNGVALLVLRRPAIAIGINWATRVSCSGTAVATTITSVLGTDTLFVAFRQTVTQATCTIVVEGPNGEVVSSDTTSPAISVTAGDQHGVCENDLLHGSTCWTLLPGGRTFEEAEAACQAWGGVTGHLASLNSLEDLAFAQLLTGSFQADAGCQSAWVGAVKPNQGSTVLTWTDGSTGFADLNAAITEAGACVTVSGTGGAAPANCQAVTACAVCERRAPGRITSVSPEQGRLGTSVTIQGVSLLGGGSAIRTVLLAGTEADVVSASNTRIIVRARTPVDSIGVAGSVEVTSSTDVQVVARAAWTPLPAGAITSVEPAIVVSGSVVQIVGQNLLGGALLDAVWVSGVRAGTVVMASETVIRFVAGTSLTRAQCDDLAQLTGADAPSTSGLGIVIRNRDGSLLHDTTFRPISGAVITPSGASSVSMVDGGDVAFNAPCIGDAIVTACHADDRELEFEIQGDASVVCKFPAAWYRRSAAEVRVSLSTGGDTPVTFQWFSSRRISFVAPKLSLSLSRGAMLGGQRVVVSGMPFLPAHSVVISVGTDSQTASCEPIVTNGETTAVACLMPILYTVGGVNVELSVDGGATFPFAALRFTSQSLLDVAPAVVRVDPNNWVAGKPVTIQWDESQLASSDRVAVVLYRFRADSQRWTVVARPTNPLNSGENTFTIPTSVVETSPRTLIQGSDGVFGSLVRSTVGDPSDLGLYMVRVETPEGHLWSDLFTFGRTDTDGACRQWANALATVLPPLQQAPVCPCTLQQALRDRRAFRDHPVCHQNRGSGGAVPNANSIFGACRLAATGGDRCILHSEAHHCVVSRGRTATGGGRTCCYTSGGALIGAGRRGAGINLFAHWEGQVPDYSHALHDITPFVHCCRRSLFTDSCNAFYGRRPATNCAGYQPPRPARARGDPHITTLDGLGYTFNPVGEFVLLESREGSGLTLQGRTAAINTNCPGKQASVFVALAIAETGSDRVQVELVGRSSLRVLVNGQEVNFEDQLRVDVRGVELAIDCSSDRVSVLMASGLQLDVDAGAGMLSFIIIPPESFRGQTRGLLGVFNGDETDDLTRPDGTVLASTSSVRDVHYEFGQLWQVTATSSVFFYAEGQSVNTFANPLFEPLFEDEPAFCGCTEQEEAALRATCGQDRECLFDAALTCDTEVADKSREDDGRWDDTIRTAVQPPIVVIQPNPDLVEVDGRRVILVRPTDGRRTVVIALFAERDTGFGSTVVIGSVTFSVLLAIPGVTIDPVTGVLTVVLDPGATTFRPFDIVVVVTADDGTQTQVVVPVVCGCGCSGTQVSLSVRSASLVGGTSMEVRGPCFGTNNNVRCRFGSIVVSGQRVSQDVAVCTSPRLVGSLADGETSVRVSVSINGGTSFPFDGGLVTVDVPQFSLSLDRGVVLGGQRVVIRGVTFESGAVVVIRVGGVSGTRVTCVVSNGQAACVMPILYVTGQVAVDLSLDGGLTFPFVGVRFTAEPLSRLVPRIVRVGSTSTSGWVSSATTLRTIRWDTSLTVGIVSLRVEVLIMDVATGRWRVQSFVSVGGSTGVAQIRVVLPGATTTTTVAVMDLGMFVIRIRDVDGTSGLVLFSDVFTLLPPGANDGEVGDVVDRCFDWAQSQLPAVEDIPEEAVCPCTSQQAAADARFFSPAGGCSLSADRFLTPSNDALFPAPDPLPTSAEVQGTDACESTSQTTCYELHQPTASGSVRSCCYMPDGGLAPPASTSFGFAFASELPEATLNPYELFLRQSIPQQLCCQLSGSAQACGLFQNQFPAASCAAYRPPWLAGITTLGHIRTADGSSFDLRAAGVFLLLGTPTLSIQIQTVVVGPTVTSQNTFVSAAEFWALTNTGVLPGSPVTRAVGVRRLAIELRAIGILSISSSAPRPDQVSVEVLVAGVALDVTCGDPIHLPGFTLQADCKRQVLTVTIQSTGVVLVINPTAGLLSITTFVGEDVRPLVRGLLGTWDDNADNDLMIGELGLPVDLLTDPDVRRAFERAWFDAVDAAGRLIDLAEDVLNGPLSLEELLGQPLFTTCNAVLGSSFQDEAEELCQGSLRCLFDAAVTCRLDIAAKSLVDDGLLDALADLLDQPPQFTDDDRKPFVVRQDGTTQTLTRVIQAFDPEGSSVQLSIYVPPGSGAFNNAQIQNGVLVISFAHDLVAEITLVVIRAVDGNGRVSYLSIEIVCECGCPARSFIPSITSASLLESVEVNASGLCLSENVQSEDIVCRFESEDDGLAFELDGMRLDESTVQCNTPRRHLSGDTVFSLSINGGEDFTLEAADIIGRPLPFTFLPANRRAVHIRSDAEHFVTLFVPRDTLCTDEVADVVCEGTAGGKDDDSSLCVSFGNATDCAGDVNHIDLDSTVDPANETAWKELSEPFQDSARKLVRSIDVAKLRRRARRAVPENVTVAVVDGQLLNDNSTRVYFWVVADGRVLPAADTMKRLLGACKVYNVATATVTERLICDAVLASQPVTVGPPEATVKDSSDDNLIWIILIIILVVLLLLLAIWFCCYWRRHRYDAGANKTKPFLTQTMNPIFNPVTGVAAQDSYGELAPTHSTRKQPVYDQAQHNGGYGEAQGSSSKAYDSIVAGTARPDPVYDSADSDGPPVGRQGLGHGPISNPGYSSTAQPAGPYETAPQSQPAWLAPDDEIDDGPQQGKRGSVGYLDIVEDPEPEYGEAEPEYGEPDYGEFGFDAPGTTNPASGGQIQQHSGSTGLRGRTKSGVFV